MQNTALENIYSQTLPHLVSGLREWSQFVEFSAHVRRPFKEAALVYAQNPKATMVADYDGWKGCGQPVRFGEKGIPVLSAKGKRYVFDITQTEDKSRPPAQFLIAQETRDELCTRYRKEKLADALSEMVRKAYSANRKKGWNDMPKIPSNWMDRTMNWTAADEKSLSPATLEKLAQLRKDEPELLCVTDEKGELIQMPSEMYEAWTCPVSKFGRDADWWLMRQYPEIHAILTETGWIETAIRYLDRRARIRFRQLLQTLPEDEARYQTEREIIYTVTPEGPPVWALEVLAEMEATEDMLAELL